MPTQHKATRTSATSIQIRTQNCFDSNLAYMDHSLPPLGFVFANQTQISISKSKRVIPKERFQKLPLFPIINTSPHKRPTFDKRDNKRDLTNQKLYSTVFKISQVVADPFITLAFIFSPFGIKHQNGINLGPLTPLPHQNLQIRTQRQ